MAYHEPSLPVISLRILVLSLLISALIFGQSVQTVARNASASQPSQKKQAKSKSKAKPTKTAQSNKQKQVSSDKRKPNQRSKSKSKRQDRLSSKIAQSKSNTRSRAKDKNLERSNSLRRSSKQATTSRDTNSDAPSDGKRALNHTSDTLTSRLDTVAKTSATEPSQAQQKVAKEAPFIIQEAILTANQTTMFKLLKPDGLEVNLMSNRGRYLPKEAIKLLSLFYQQYTPTSLKWVHKGRTKSGLHYVLGKLQCLTNIGQAKSSTPKPEAKTTEVALYLVYRIKNSQVMIQNLELDR